MTHIRPRRVRIDLVLSEIEDNILAASDDEILKEAGTRTRAVDEVRALIERQLQDRTRPVPREPAARRQLLADLLRARPALASTMSVSFSGGNTPSDDEVDELIDALLRRGVIKQKID
jgi:hypothetical protein